MTALELAMASALFCALSGLPALSPRIPLFLGRKIAFLLISAGATIGLAAVVQVLLLRTPMLTYESTWQIPVGTLLFRLDHLSAFFLIPVLVVSCCIALYSCGYCSTSPDNRAESRLTCYLGLIIAAIIMLLIAANGITLLIFWEAMALLVYLAMNLEHSRAEVRGAGLQYLVVSHITTLLIIVVYALSSRHGVATFPAGGSLDPSTPLATGIFLVAVVAFGMKAGIMPLHIWLPAAHANAPSHISAIMSGVLIKMGIYGLLRTISFFGVPPIWWGVLLLSLGVVSAVVGVLFAIGQHDIKRLLAYHSIENIGIIVMGIGVALVGTAGGNQSLYVLGMAGALLHVLNHALFKSLLFLGAGAIIHVAGTRDIDRMAGLARALPLTSLAFLTGSVAICGLPPLNGFVSEFLIYIGIFKGFGSATGSAAVLLALAAPLLALTGGLALACFVKVYGMVFLGAPRQELPPPHESPAMTAAMAVLGCCCLLIGILPWTVTFLLEPVITSIAPAPGATLPTLRNMAGLDTLSIAAAILLGLIIILTLWYRRRLAAREIGTTGTWDCGYAAPAPSMQYTSSSFAEMLVRIFGGILRPERHVPEIKELFPERARFESHVPEVVLDKGILPFFAAVDKRLAAIRRLQSGQLTHYILYIFMALIVLLALSDFL